MPQCQNTPRTSSSLLAGPRKEVIPGSYIENTDHETRQTMTQDSAPAAAGEPPAVSGMPPVRQFTVDGHLVWGIKSVPHHLDAQAVEAVQHVVIHSQLRHTLVELPDRYVQNPHAVQ